MPIPTYDALMLPVLRRSAEKTWTMRDLTARIADDLALSEEDRSVQIPSGAETVIASRVHWAKFYLKHAGLIEQPKRGSIRISSKGMAVIAENPTKIDLPFLKEIPEFLAFYSPAKVRSEDVIPSDQTMVADADPSRTPEEQIVAASTLLDEAVRDALLARILEGTPQFFEKLIVDLLLAMGYGGSRSDAGERIGGTGDGGIDGVIREDHLGLDKIYLQAKRYKAGNTVGSETVQSFIGALVGRSAQKGVLITTSAFTKAAIIAANQAGSFRIVLIDGRELTKLMVAFNVGVRVAQTVEIKRVDLDYFEDGEPE